jgi:hypothetical protein
MPDLSEFLNNNNPKDYDLEDLPGIRACLKCDEDVDGAKWDPVELLMYWKCSKGHETIHRMS